MKKRNNQNMNVGVTFFAVTNAILRSCLQGARSRLQGTRLCLQGARFRLQGSAYKEQGSAYKEQGSAYKEQGSAYKEQGFVNKEQGSACKGQGAVYKIQSSASKVARLELRSAGHDNANCDFRRKLKSEHWDHHATMCSLTSFPRGPFSSLLS